MGQTPSSPNTPPDESPLPTTEPTTMPQQMLFPKNDITTTEQEMFEKEYNEWMRNEPTFEDNQQSEVLSILVQNLLENQDYLFMDDINKIDIETFGANIVPLRPLSYGGITRHLTHLSDIRDKEYKIRQKKMWEEIFTKIIRIDPLTEIEEFKTDSQGNFQLRGSFSRAWFQCLNGHETEYPVSAYMVIKEDALVSEKSKSEEIRTNYKDANNIVYFKDHMVDPFRDSVTWKYINDTTAQLISSYFLSKIRLDSSTGQTIIPYIYPIWRDHVSLGENKITENTILGVNHTKYHTQMIEVFENKQNISPPVFNAFYNETFTKFDAIDEMLVKKYGIIKSSKPMGGNKNNRDKKIQVWKALLDPKIYDFNEQGDISFNWWPNFFQFDAHVMREIITYATAECVLKWYKWYFDTVLDESVVFNFQDTISINTPSESGPEDIREEANTRAALKYYQRVLKKLRPLLEKPWECQAILSKQKIWTLMDMAIEKHWGTDWNNWPSIYEQNTTILNSFTERIMNNLPLQVLDDKKYYAFVKKQ
jgi:hypothetical protein